MIAGDAIQFATGDAIEWAGTLPNNSLDLVITSPPYEDARTYGIGFARKGEEWVKWMVDVVTALSPKCRGPIFINCEGRTRRFRYSSAPFLLAADLHRAGFHLRKPLVFHRVGVPGSGGRAEQHKAAGGSADWFRNDWEPILVVCRPGKLPWADVLKLGNRPKHPPGGAVSNRLTDGTRANEGPREKKMRRRKGDREAQGYNAPEIANPGNLLPQRYTAAEVSELLRQESDVITCTVGGGHMGHSAAHDNEAPFPCDLVEPLVLSFCPPGGTVGDPFFGSGTVAQVCHENGRRFVGCDLRASQAELARKRLKTVQPKLFF